MPRRRMITPDLWTDSKLAKASRDERLLFIGLFSNADDEGRIMANPAYLKSIIFPYDSDITPDRIKEMRDHLAQVNPNILLYQNSGEEFIQLKQWPCHQKPRYPKPSRLPPPPAFNQKDAGLQKKDAGLQKKDAGLQRNGALVKSSLSLGSLKGFADAKQSLQETKNKVGFLVQVFKAFHAHAPPEDFEDLGGRLAGVLKLISNDYGYLLKLIWDTASVAIAGSHLNYIQGKIRGEKKGVAKISTDEEIEESLR